MSHISEIDSRANPDGLQEIRSWAARSPDSARPGFRTRRRPASFRLSSRLAASIGFALLLLLSLAGYRFLQNGRDMSGLAAVPEQVASSAPAPAPPSRDAAETASVPRAEAQKGDEAPPAAEAIPPARPAPEERTQKEATVRRKPASKELAAVSRVAMSREAFESEPAILLSAPTAVYPDAARGTGTSAEVIVGFTIDETGAVRGPAVESSRVQGNAPEALFKEAALVAARRARFHPARERGVSTSSWSTLTFSFETGSRPFLNGSTAQ